MSDEQKGEATEGTKEGKPLSLPEVIWAAAHWIVKRDLALRLAVVAFLMVLGGVGVVYAQGKGKDLIGPLERADEVISARVTKLEQADVSRDRRDLERDRITMETNLNVRLFLESHRIKPIDVPRLAADAGL